STTTETGVLTSLAESSATATLANANAATTARSGRSSHHHLRSLGRVIWISPRTRAAQRLSNSVYPERCAITFTRRCRPDEHLMTIAPCLRQTLDYVLGGITRRAVARDRDPMTAKAVAASWCPSASQDRRPGPPRAPTTPGSAGQH